MVKKFKLRRRSCQDDDEGNIEFFLLQERRLKSFDKGRKTARLRCFGKRSAGICNLHSNKNYTRIKQRSFILVIYCCFYRHGFVGSSEVVTCSQLFWANSCFRTLLLCTCLGEPNRLKKKPAYDQRARNKFDSNVEAPFKTKNVTDEESAI